MKTLLILTTLAALQLAGQFSRVQALPVQFTDTDLYDVEAGQAEMGAGTVSEFAGFGSDVDEDDVESDALRFRAGREDFPVQLQEGDAFEGEEEQEDDDSEEDLVLPVENDVVEESRVVREDDAVTEPAMNSDLDTVTSEFQNLNVLKEEADAVGSQDELDVDEVEDEDEDGNVQELEQEEEDEEEDYQDAKEKQE